MELSSLACFELPRFAGTFWRTICLKYIWIKDSWSIQTEDHTWVCSLFQVNIFFNILNGIFMSLWPLPPSQFASDILWFATVCSSPVRQYPLLACCGRSWQQSQETHQKRPLSARSLWTFAIVCASTLPVSSQDTGSSLVQPHGQCVSCQNCQHQQSHHFVLRWELRQPFTLASIMTDSGRDGVCWWLVRRMIFES